jgi:hypothetical protein
LYDAEIVAGSPLKFEKHPQEFFFREQTLCENESQPNGHFQKGPSSLRTPSSRYREHSMGVVRDRDPEKRRSSIRATAYIRISAEEPLNSVNNQKAAIHRYAKTRKLHIALICSDQHRANTANRF